MRIKWKAILSVLVLITAICTVFTLLLLYHFDSRTREFINGRQESASVLAESLFDNISESYRKRIISFTDPHTSHQREEMIRAFAERDRERLLELCLPLWKVLQKENRYFGAIGWILPDNTVFLRTHKPGKFGDNVEKVRADVAWVNREKKPVSGFKVGIYSMQYRVIQPVFYQGRYVGAVQFGIKAAILFDLLQKRLQTPSGLAVLNTELGSVPLKDSNWTPGPDYSVLSLDPELQVPAVAAVDWESGSARLELDGKPFVLLNVLTLDNYRKQPLGTYFIALDLSWEEQSRRQLLLFAVLLSVFLLIVSFFILNFSYGGLVQRIVDLNEKLEHKVRDRTARLRDKEQQLQQILDRAPVGILIVELEKQQVLYANPAITNLLGHKGGDLESRVLAELLAPEDKKRALAEFGEHMEGKRSMSVHISFICRDEERVIADVVSVRLNYEGQDCLAGFILDRSEQTEMIEQLNRARKMEAIGLMAGGVAHDLNNILSGVIAYPELLLMQLPPDSPLRNPLAAIHESSLRAAAVVDDLLTVARGAATVRKPHDLNTLIREYCSSPEYGTMIASHPEVDCRLELSADPAVINCSPLHIRKSIMNLLTNACEALGRKGEVVIATENRTITARDNEKTPPPGEYVLLTIRDTGPGIAKKDLDHIFEPFYTRKKMGRSGTGLGLAVVWNTVEDHGGWIKVASDSQGTCFELYFPLCTEPGAGTEPEKEAAVAKGGHETILVVDDEPSLRDIACRILETLGYESHAVAGGEEALEFLAQRSVDLVVLDMQMEPGMSGRRTFERIREMYPDQRAIIASGYSVSKDVQATLKMGAATFIKKPYSLAELGNAVKSALARSS